MLWIILFGLTVFLIEPLIYSIGLILLALAVVQAFSLRHTPQRELKVKPVITKGGGGGMQDLI